MAHKEAEILEKAVAVAVAVDVAVAVAVAVAVPLIFAGMNVRTREDIISCTHE